MPSKTDDIEFAITTTLSAGGQVTLADLNERLYGGYPQLRDEDPRWIGAAVSNLLKDGRLTAIGWDRNGAFTAERLVELSRR